ncbi:MAG: glycosyltransferase family 4 protein [Nitrospinota bacterium]|nr:glycosyltransferase family 4 protein [Nitrospinota bacterium]
MKSLHILHSESATGWGGQEIRIFQESQLLLERGHRVSLVCQPTSYLCKKSLAISSPNFNCYPLLMKSTTNPFSIVSIFKILKKTKADIIHTHSSIDSWLVGSVAKLSQIPVIRSRHISIPIKNMFPNNWLYSRIPRKIITSGEAISEVVKSVPGVNPGNVKSVSAGVDFRRFDFKINGIKIREELGVNPGQPLIGKIGVIRGWKGYNYLLEAAPIILKKFPDARFVFVGNGPGFEQTKSIAKSLGLKQKLTFLGHRDDIPEIMAGLDIQVLASYAGEGTPQVIPQAFAMKTPLVATRVGSVPEMLGQGKRGILVEPKSSVDLANGIINLIENPGIRNELAEKGYEFCRNELGIDRMIDETITIYEEALKY